MKPELTLPISADLVGHLDQKEVVEQTRLWTQNQLASINLGANCYRGYFRFYDHRNNPSGLKMLCKYTKPLELIRFIYPRSKELYVYHGLVLPHLRLSQLRAISLLVDQVVDIYDKESYQDFGFEDYDDFHRKTDIDTGDGFMAGDDEQEEEIYDRREEKLVSSKLLPTVFTEVVNHYSRINNISLPGSLSIYGHDHPAPNSEFDGHQGYYAYDDTGKNIYLNASELSTGHNTRPKRCSDFLETTVHEWIHHLLLVLDREHGLFDPTETTPGITHSRLFYRIERKLGIPKEEVRIGRGVAAISWEEMQEGAALAANSSI